MDREAVRLHRAVGDRLRHLRTAQPDLTQERLADKAGLHFTFIGRVERGETAATVDSVAAICRALGGSLSEFFSPFEKHFDLTGPRRRQRPRRDRR